MKQQRLNPSQISMYMNPLDRWRTEQLLETLLEEGDSGLLDKKQQPSTSALFRRLVREEMERRGMALEPESEGDNA